MSELYTLPEGWEWKELQFFGKFIRGVSYKKEQLLESPTNDSFTLLRANNIQNELELDDIQIVPKDVAKGKEIKDGDILFAMSSGSKHLVGKNILLNGLKNYTFGAFCSIYRNQKNDVLNNYYLSYVLKSNLYRDKLSGLSMGANINNLKSSDLEIMKIPLPPLEEQKRIVAKLDNLFAKIDKAIALHQKNCEEADIFMASVLNNVFVELEEKYGLDNIGNMIDILTDYHSNGAYKNLKENVELLDKEDYALMIRATDLENEDYSKNVKYITESAYNYMSKSKVFGGEIILPKIGTIGNVYFMPYLKRPVSLAMNLFMLRCSDKVLNKYMFLFLKSSKGNEDILNKANGAVTKTITKDAVRSIELPFPPIETQQKVVAYLDEISQKMEKIKQIQKEKMQSLKALKASILDQAFKGEL